MLLTKTVVQPSKDGSFLVKAVNLNFQNVTLFKNQKIGKLSDIEEVLNTAHDYQIQHDEHPVVSPIQTENIDFLHDIGIELNQSDLKRHERDVFSKNKRDLGTCKLGTKHHIHLKPDTVPVKQPKFVLHVDQCLQFSLHIFNWLLPDDHSIYTADRRRITSAGVVELLQYL